MSFQGGTRRWTGVAGSILAVMLVLLSAVPAAASRGQLVESPVTDGRVESVTQLGNRVYVAGPFRYIGPNTGPGAALDAATGQVDRAFPYVDGVVLATVADGSGGFYVGGSFGAVGGVPRRSLAHVLADGSVDPAFDPGADGPVTALALSVGRLFVGGVFQTIGGRSRGHLAELDAATGAVDHQFDPDISFNGVPLTHQGAVATPPPPVQVTSPPVSRPGVSPPSAYCREPIGATSPLPVPVSSDGTSVNALAVSGSRVYVGGNFDSVGGFERDNLVALDAGTGNIDETFDPDANTSGYNPHGTQRRHDVNGPVDALAISGSRLYLAGSFTSIVGRSRNRLAALDATTGALDHDFDPAPDGAVSSLVATADHVYAAGDFGFIGGVPRTRIAALDPATGAPDPSFTAQPDGPVDALAVNGSRLFLGGEFHYVDGQTRFRLAAVDLATSHLDAAFNPSADGTVDALAADDSRVYAGGSFQSSGGLVRRGVAAITASTGLVDPGFAAPPDLHPSALTAGKSLLYGVGRRRDSRGKLHHFIAALDPATGAVSSRFLQLPAHRDTLLLAAGDTLYASRPLHRTRLSLEIIALDAATGQPDPRFQPRIRGSVLAMLAAGKRLYAGGALFRDTFRRDERGRLRPHRIHYALAALDERTGQPEPKFHPHIGTRIVPAEVTALASGDGRLYAGGTFALRNPDRLADLLALDPVTGSFVRRYMAIDQEPSQVLAGADHRLYVVTPAKTTGDITALAATTGKIDTSFAPAVSPVCAIALTRGRVYAGGSFPGIGPIPHRGLAAFSLG